MEGKKGYARVSKSKEDKISIPQQTHGFINLGVDKKEIWIDDGKTAGLDNDNPSDIRLGVEGDWFVARFNLKKRPSFKEMLLDAGKKTFNQLYIYTWSRFSRYASFQDLVWIYLQRLGIEVKPTNDTTDDIARRFMGIIDQKQRDDTRNKINDVKRLKFDFGLYTGAQRKCGYKWAKISLKGNNYNTLELDPDNTNYIYKKKHYNLKEEIAMVKEIRKSSYSKELCEGYGIKAQTFYNIKNDRFYNGYVNLKGEFKKGIHKPIISQELFDKVQEKIKKN